MPGRGRPATSCSAACRQRAWALRAAERQINAGADPRPTVVREVVERETVVRIEPPTITRAFLDAKEAADRAVAAPSVPATGRGWVLLLAGLTDQLVDSAHPVAREHWQHERLYTALMTALAALDGAHPGGLDQFGGRRR